MIMHNCIKCDYFEMIPMATTTPCFSKYICPECNEEQYIYHSRIEPKTYPKEMISFDKNGHIKICDEVEKDEYDDLSGHWLFN